jgi:hypothetical protein
VQPLACRSHEARCSCQRSLGRTPVNWAAPLTLYICVSCVTVLLGDTNSRRARSLRHWRVTAWSFCACARNKVRTDFEVTFCAPQFVLSICLLIIQGCGGQDFGIWGGTSENVWPHTILGVGPPAVGLLGGVGRGTLGGGFRYLPRAPPARSSPFQYEARQLGGVSVRSSFGS